MTLMKTIATSVRRPRGRRGLVSIQRSDAGRGCLVLLGALVPATASQAFEARDLFAFNAGPVVVKPSLGTVAGYSDNVYFLPDDSPLEALGLIESREDFNFVISPGVSARLGRPDADAKLEFSYRLDQILYVENTESDSLNHYFNLGAAVAGSRLTYNCANSLQILGSILTGYEAAVDGVVVPPGNVDRTVYSLDHGVFYGLTAKSRLQLGGAVYGRDYTSDSFQGARFFDSLDWNARGGWDYAITERLRLGAELGFGQQQQTSNTDLIPDPDGVDSFTASATANGNLTAKLSGNIRIGYQDRERYGGNLAASIALTQKFSEKTTVSLNYNRNGGLGATSGAGTIADTVSLGFSQAVGNRNPWVFTGRVGYVHNDYVDSDLTLENFTVTVGASRRLAAWASLFVNYTFESAERSTYDYQVNQVNLGLNLGL